MPLARTNDPGTSHVAARTAYNPNEVQARVLDIVRDASAFGGGITHAGIIATYSRRARVNAWTMPSESSIRSRCKELERAGHVQMLFDDEGKPMYGETPGGNKTHLWAAPQ